MSMYTPVTGVLARISWPDTDLKTLGCSMTLTLQSETHGIVNITLPSSAYVLNGERLRTGDRITCFYDSSAPVPLIYPPQYQAVAAAHTPEGTTAVLDSFNEQLLDSGENLKLNLSRETNVSLPNGQPFAGYLAGKILMVLYRSVTLSIPAQTTPEQIIVFCQSPQNES